MLPIPKQSDWYLLAIGFQSNGILQILILLSVCDAVNTFEK
jgi:hypothetical protein